MFMSAIADDESQRLVSRRKTGAKDQCAATPAIINTRTFPIQGDLADYPQLRIETIFY
jgi:hypothetical protein